MSIATQILLPLPKKKHDWMIFNFCIYFLWLTELTRKLSLKSIYIICGYFRQFFNYQDDSHLAIFNSNATQHTAQISSKTSRFFSKWTFYQLSYENSIKVMLKIRDYVKRKRRCRKMYFQTGAISIIFIICIQSGNFVMFSINSIRPHYYRRFGFQDFIFCRILF